jgi:hypothetical protein
VHGYQWFLLGMMFAWTPSLVVLALMLRSALMLRRSEPDASEVRTL